MRTRSEVWRIVCGLAALSMLAPVLVAQAGTGTGTDVGSSPIIRGSAPSSQVCHTRRNDTVEKLLECIQQDALWNRLAVFQKIADENPDRKGHGNRDTGTSGYIASVNYVASLMQQAGYLVTIQPYPYEYSEVVGIPQLTTSDQSYRWKQDWFVAGLSGVGDISAPVQPASGSGSGCSQDDFKGFKAGSIALLERGTCAYDTQVENATTAGASGVVLYNCPETPASEEGPRRARGRNDGGAFEAKLSRQATIPVAGITSYVVGSDLLKKYRMGSAPIVHLEVHTQRSTGVDYNLIADSPFGDANQIVVVDAHLDSIYGAGMLDNASGSTTIIEIALSLAKTPTRNRLRYIWFGGEEIGLLGSAYYTTHLSQAERAQLAFDVDVDVTATPNFDYLVADPAYAPNVKRFPKNVVPESKIGNRYFADFFYLNRVPSLPAWFGNDGTDSNSFSLIGIPNTGILTQQDCCKTKWEVEIWGGFRGNYEGQVPGFNGGCVDYPHRWCDSLSNNDPNVLELASQAAAYVTFNLANLDFHAEQALK